MPRKKLVVVTCATPPGDRLCPAQNWRDALDVALRPGDVVLVVGNDLVGDDLVGDDCEGLVSTPTGVSLVRFADDGRTHYPDGRAASWARDHTTPEAAVVHAIAAWRGRGGLAFHVEWDDPYEDRLEAWEYAAREERERAKVDAARGARSWTHLDATPFERYSGFDAAHDAWPWTFADDDLVVLDTETSGKVPARHQLLEVAAIRTNAKGQVLDVYDARVDFDPTLPYESEALTHNRYLQRVARGDWKDARSLEEVIDRLLPILEHAPALVAHYASFDRAVIEAACDRVGVEAPVFRTTFDTCVMARRLLQKTGRTQNAKLDTVCDYYGISNAGNHAALVDAKRCLAVYKRLAAGDVERGAVAHAL